MNFAKIHKLVFEIFCLQKLITQLSALTFFIFRNCCHWFLCTAASNNLPDSHCQWTGECWLLQCRICSLRHQKPCWYHANKLSVDFPLLKYLAAARWTRQITTTTLLFSTTFRQKRINEIDREFKWAHLIDLCHVTDIYCDATLITNLLRLQRDLLTSSPSKAEV